MRLENSKRVKWANILCHEGMKPYKVIVTDGVVTNELPVTMTNLKTVLKAVKDVYGIPQKRILITEVLDTDD